MHVAFIHNNYESLGIEYLSSYLKNARHETSLAFEPGLFGSFFAHSKKAHRLLNFDRHIIDKVESLKPDMVAFSVISDNYAWAAGLAQEIKKRLDVPIVFGGIHPTSIPENIIRENFIDFVIAGEGEEAFLELIDCLEDGKEYRDIRNLAFKKNGHIVVNPLRPPLEDIDSLPFPDKDLFFNEYKGLVNKAYMLVTSRGCAFSCSYCLNNVLNNLYPDHSYFRRRSIDNCISELTWAIQRYHIQRVTFYDEDFTLNKAWLIDFLKIYKIKVKLPFFCCIHPSHLDEEMVDLLSDAGCAAANIGIQTYSEDYRKAVLNRHGNNKEIAAALKCLGQSKIFVYSNVILGLPAQTEQELIKTLEFCSEHKADIASTYWLRYYPKTAIVETARKMGVLSEAHIKDIEESREYAPYAIKGSTFNKNASKIGNLILFSGILPDRLVKFVIKNKFYRYGPSNNLLFPAIIIIGFLKKIFQGKKNPFHYFNILDYCRFYLFFLNKRLASCIPRRSQ